MEPKLTKESFVATWVIIFLLTLFILIKGFYAFTVVGDLGQPTWDYRPVMDVPGQSPYAVYQLLPNPQHVRGKEGE
jgi:hypothetical protein